MEAREDEARIIEGNMISYFNVNYDMVTMHIDEVLECLKYANKVL